MLPKADGFPLIDNFSNISKQQHRDVYAHIATCEQCADYKEVADSTAALLGSFSPLLKQISVDDIMFNKIKRRVKKDRRQTLTSVAVMVTSLFALLWFYSQGNMPLEAGAILSAWTILGGIVAWWSSRKATKFSYISQPSSDEFLLDWAKELVTEIKITTVIASILSLEIAFVLFNLIRDSFSSPGAVVLLGGNAVLAIGVIYAFVIELPALKKELLSIKGAFEHG